MSTGNLPPSDDRFIEVLKQLGEPLSAEREKRARAAVQSFGKWMERQNNWHEEQRVRLRERKKDKALVTE